MVASFGTETERFHFFVSSVDRYPDVIPLNDLEGVELQDALARNRAAIVSFPWDETAKELQDQGAGY